jgi:hypothetical protein
MGWSIPACAQQLGKTYRIGMAESAEWARVVRDAKIKID